MLTSPPRPVLIVVVLLIVAGVVALAVYLLKRCPPLRNQQNEVYLINAPKVQSASQAQALAAQYGAQVASPAQVQAAYTAGADWCIGGWANDGHNYTLTQQTVSGCRTQGINKDLICDPNYTCALGVLAYGPKPAKTILGAPTAIEPFNRRNGQWSQFC